MILYEANAGTGKTFRINTLILEGLLKKGYEPQQILATTFTVKGASEIRNRLLGALKKILKGEEIEELKQINIDAEYLKKNRKRLIEIFSNIDKLFIGTIHSWCLKFLKTFPSKANLSPSLNIDEEKNILNQFFEKEWNKWIFSFIKENPLLVKHFPLDSIKKLAKELLNYPPDSLEQVSNTDDSKIFSIILNNITERIPNFNNLKTSPLQLTDDEKIAYEYVVEYVANKLCRSTIDKRMFLDYIHYNNALINNLLEKIKILITSVRSNMDSKGYIAFETLLHYTREILRTDKGIRNFIKNMYKLILVDEAQDTSPIQYEIIFYISEKNNEFNVMWEDINIEPGKLIIVGDPKQSIYSFRGADLKAYKDICKKTSKVEHLTKNTRSCKNILQFTNDVAQILFENEGISFTPSEYFKKEVKKIDKCEQNSQTKCIKIVNLQFGKVSKYEKIYKEAMWVANDICKKHLSGEPFKNFAILLRKIQKPYIYIDVFSKYNIPFVIESDRYFYQTQEVIDFINLINYIIDPQDNNALAGLLRSPILSCNDYELFQFFKKGYTHPSFNQGLRKYIFDRIKYLQHKVFTTSFSELVDMILKEIPVLELLQICYKKDTVPFNILKFRQKIWEYELSYPHMGRMEFKRFLINNCRYVYDIGQEPLFDEQTDAVKILSIHKSKGLEFPVVYLPCVDAETQKEKYENDDIVYDWTKNKIGIRCGGITNKNYLELKYIEDIDHQRGNEEKRVFYVGITRAMEQLIITYSEAPNVQQDNQCDNICKVISVIRNKLSNKYDFEDIKYSEDFISEDVSKEKRLHIELQDVETVMQKWEKIKDISMQIRKRFVSVSELLSFEAERFYTSEEKQEANQKLLLVGSACHFILSKIDFKNPAQVGKFLEIWLKRNKLYIEDNLLKEIEKECKSIFENFFNNSPAYIWLRETEILAREVPILYQENGQIISGRVDLIARKGNVYYVVDYKTADIVGRDDIILYNKQLDYYIKALNKKFYPVINKVLILLKSSNILFL